MIRNVRFTHQVRQHLVELVEQGIVQAKDTVVSELRPTMQCTGLQTEESKIDKIRNKASKLERLGHDSIPLSREIKGLRSSQSIDCYAQDTPLTDLFGNHAETKVIAALLSEKEATLPEEEIARLAGVTQEDAKSHLQTLEQFDLVTPVEAGADGEFELNTDHDTIADLYAIERRTLRDRL